MSTIYVTVRAAAQRLGLSYESVRELLHKRRLKGVRLDGGKQLVNVADLERLIRARRPRAI